MTDTLASALADLQKDLPTIEKQHTASVRSEKGSYSYDYADLTDVTEAILPKLAAVGLSWLCMPTLNHEGKFVLAYELMHVSGEKKSGEYPLPGSGTPQTIGGHITYARRYALCAVTGVAPKGDDNDAAETAGAPKNRTAQRQSRAQPSPRETKTGPETAPERTAQRAKVTGPPLPGDDLPASAKLISGPQRGMVLALFDKAGVEARGQRLDISRRVVGRAELGSANDLTAQEASRLIDWLTKAEKDGFSDAITDLYIRTDDWDDPRLGDDQPVQSPLATAQAAAKEET